MTSDKAGNVQLNCQILQGSSATVCLISPFNQCWRYVFLAGYASLRETVVSVLKFYWKSLTTIGSCWNVSDAHLKDLLNKRFVYGQVLKFIAACWGTAGAGAPSASSPNAATAFSATSLCAKMRLAYSWMSCTVVSLLQWNLARDILMALAIEYVHNLSPNLSYVSTLPDITHKKQ